MDRTVNTCVMFAVITPVFPAASVFAFSLQFSLESHRCLPSAKCVYQVLVIIIQCDRGMNDKINEENK